MTVADLRRLLKAYPDHMVVKVTTDDGNAFIHEDPTLEQATHWRMGLSTSAGWRYEEIEQPVLIIK